MHSLKAASASAAWIFLAAATVSLAACSSDKAADLSACQADALEAHPEPEAFQDRWTGIEQCMTGKGYQIETGLAACGMGGVIVELEDCWKPVGFFEKIGNLFR